MTAVKNTSIPRLTNRSLVQLTGALVSLELDISDAAGDDYDIVTDDAIEVVDVIVIKTGAGAGNTIQIKNGATAISDAIAAAVDKAVTRAGSIDRAQSTIPLGGTLRFTTTRAAGSAAMRVFVTAVVKTIATALVTAP